MRFSEGRKGVCRDYPPDLDLRQVSRASEGRGHQLESNSNLGSSWRPSRRTGAVGRISGPRLETPAAVGGTASMKDFVWRRIPHRLRRASSPPGRLVKYKADLGTRGSPLESSKAERASRPGANNDCNPPAEGPGLGEGKRATNWSRIRRWSGRASCRGPKRGLGSSRSRYTA
jgi:hypothetical protein